MELSVLVTSLPLSFAESLAALARMGFRHVDVAGTVDRSDAEREALADSGLIVACAALGRDLPAGSSLDASDLPQRRQAVEIVERQIADAAQLGARSAYLVPCKTAAGLAAFTDSCEALASFARSRMIQLCIEHFPGSALASVADTLAWLETSGLEDLKLLIDLGHCLLSKEDPAGAVTQAGARLGYVHLDDNDGAGDLHWPLLTGALTEATLTAFLRRLRDSDYRGGIALELSAKLADPLGNLVKSKEIAERAI